MIDLLIMNNNNNKQLRSRLDIKIKMNCKAIVFEMDSHNQIDRSISYRLLALIISLVTIDFHKRLVALEQNGSVYLHRFFYMIAC